MASTEIENPWDVESLYKFQHFNCPICSYKNDAKQDFVNHAVNSHPESRKYFMKILHHDSFSNVIIPMESEAEQPSIEFLKSELSEINEVSEDQFEKTSSTTNPLDFQITDNDIKIEANFDSNTEKDTSDKLESISENEISGVSKRSKRTPKPKKQFAIEKYGKLLY